MASVPRSRSIGGFSIIEMMIVLVILTVVFSAAFMVQARVSKASAQITNGTTALRASLDALNALRQDLSQARIEAVALNGSSVTFSLPVFDPLTKSCLDASGNVVWGINDGNGPKVGGNCTISFTPLKKRFESQEKLDLNGDGDQSDVFEEGRLVKKASTGTLMAMPKITLLLPYGNYGGDVDSDAVSDPIFAIAGTHQLALRMARPREAGPTQVRSYVMAFLDAK